MFGVQSSRLANSELLTLNFEQIIMQTLDFSSFLRTVLIIIVVYQVSKFLVKIWLRSKINDYVQRSKNTVNDKDAEHLNRNQGKVTIKTPGKNEGSTSAGEYVDYEEVK